MSETSFSDSFLALLPLPLVVVKEVKDDLNHPLVYINNRFKEIIGWELNEIPDKNTWWLKAYPDPSYQKVVVRQWELAVEVANHDGVSIVMMEVNIQTKTNGEQRFKVYSERKSSFIDGHYVVIFEPQRRSNSEP
ncbi:MAG: hypothetical protein ACI88A_002355 [Paraglaciecola sp.]